MDIILILAFLGDPDLPPGSKHSGGLNKTVKELIDYFSNSSIQTLLITSVIGHERIEYRKQNMHIYKIPITEEEYLTQDLLIERKQDFLDQIHLFLEKHNYHMIHSLYWFSGYLSITLSNIFQVPFIHNIISSAYEKISNQTKPKCKSQFNIECEIFHQAKYLIAITKSEQDMLMLHYHIDKDKIIIVGRPVDSMFSELYYFKKSMQYPLINQKSIAFQERWMVEGAFVYVGRLVQIKGVKQIIQAWIALYQAYQDLTPPLWIVGGTSEQISSFRDELYQIGIDIIPFEHQHKLYWWGTLPAYAIASILQKASVLINHSKFEAGGRVVIEAMARGIPVIATDRGFAKDLIFPWRNGFIVEYGNILDLSTTMRYFIKQPFLSNVLGLQAHETIMSKLEEWKYFRNYEDMYADIERYVPSLPSLKLQDRESDRIDLFPYIDIKMEIQNTQDYTVEEYFQTTCYNWKITMRFTQETFEVKQFYHKLNPYFFLYSEEEPVISAFYQFDRMIYSSSFTSILPLIDSSHESLYIAHKETSTVQMNDFNELFTYECIEELHNTYSDHRSRYSSYKRFIQTLQKDYKEMVKQIDFLNDYFTLAHSSLQASFPQGCNYGKSLITNIVAIEQEVYLLPTDTIFYGDLGVDEALTLIEITTSSEIDITMLSELYKNHRHIYLWIGALLAEIILIQIYKKQDYKANEFRLVNYIEHYNFNMKC